MKDILAEFKDYRQKGADSVLNSLYPQKKELEQKIHIFNVLQAITELKDMLGDFKANEIHSMCVIFNTHNVDLTFFNKNNEDVEENEQHMESLYSQRPDKYGQYISSVAPIRDKVTNILQKIDRNLDLFHPSYLEGCRHYPFRLSHKGLNHLQDAFLNEELDKILSHALLDEKLKNDKGSPKRPKI